MHKLILIPSLLSCLLFAGCHSTYSVINIKHEIEGIDSTTSFITKKNESYGLIDISAGKHGYCHVTVNKKVFTNQGFHISSKSRNNKDLAVICLNDNNYFIQSKTFKTYTNLSVDDKHQPERLYLSFKLVNPSNKKIIELHDYSVIIDKDTMSDLSLTQ